MPSLQAHGEGGRRGAAGGGPEHAPPRRGHPAAALLDGAAGRLHRDQALRGERHGLSGGLEGHPRTLPGHGACSQGCEDGCTLIPNNCFTVTSELQPFPLGIRIDYILYKVMGTPLGWDGGGNGGGHLLTPLCPCPGWLRLHGEVRGAADHHGDSPGHGYPLLRPRGRDGNAARPEDGAGSRCHPQHGR